MLYLSLCLSLCPFSQASLTPEAPATLASAVPHSIELCAETEADSDGGLFTSGVVQGFATKGPYIYLNIDGKLFLFYDKTGTYPVPEIGAKVVVFSYWSAPADSGVDYFALAYVAS